MTDRTVRTATNNTPPSLHINYSCPGPKNWTSPTTHLTPRSPPRIRPNNRTRPLHMTKARTLCPPPPTSTKQPNTARHPRSAINTNRRLRRPKPNPATKNPGILIHRPPRLNNLNSAIFTNPHPPHTYIIPNHNLLRLPHIHPQQNHNNQCTSHILSQNPHSYIPLTPCSPIPRRPPSANWLHTKMTNPTRTN
ncbi:unnamed protein product [Tetraodon nigroviridis]|uniref:(spotted green pufferfish) hypothetical protein n=1 Tax=Tetraodon nigroviridis TaxID=99883 RepID=Q4T495_TETNG|nr:unnamed protein product [Tetraodon nigroviridis]